MYMNYKGETFQNRHNFHENGLLMLNVINNVAITYHGIIRAEARIAPGRTTRCDELTSPRFSASCDRYNTLEVLAAIDNVISRENLLRVRKLCNEAESVARVKGQKRHTH